ncbi:MAG TPA: rhodanese-like domain-containing protein [Candidatus Limnocylindrales bacterium]|jgi:thiosulfate/3-mercaptopyruvate sulfurtransferase|nr:rhodanese-like domain-containing protein [Candidatus Limnocylindrales bacterium]
MTTDRSTTSSAVPIPSISIAEVRDCLADPALVIVDVRPLRAYNGWRHGDDVRGGHIPGAVAFPAAWLSSVDRPEVDRLLDEKGLTDAATVVVYGDVEDAIAVAARLAAADVGDVRILDGGFSAWAADPGLPVDRLARHHRLVHVDWLAEVLAGGRPEAAPAGDVLLFHVNFGVPEEYAENHIPGALYLDTNWLEDPADWNRRSPQALESAVRALGITRDTTVVLYGRDTEGQANEKWPGRRAGQIAATRALMILHYAGVDDVRLLDGGYDWWVRAGHPLETVERTPTPIASFGASIPVRPQVIVDLDEAKQILADPAGAALVSVRTWREHIGNVSGYNYIGPAGRIKGDVWGNCGTDAYHMQHYRNVDNTMRAYPEIAANWAAAGITADKRVAFYCGTGWRASETWFYAHLQGWDAAAVYDGGWFEWSQDPLNNPIEVGEPLDESAA